MFPGKLDVNSFKIEVFMCPSILPQDYIRTSKSYLDEMSHIAALATKMSPKEFTLAYSDKCADLAQRVNELSESFKLETFSQDDSFTIRWNIHNTCRTTGEIYSFFERGRAIMGEDLCKEAEECVALYKTQSAEDTRGQLERIQKRAAELLKDSPTLLSKVEGQIKKYEISILFPASGSSEEISFSSSSSSSSSSSCMSSMSSSMSLSSSSSTSYSSFGT
jgi:hypothetical protein